MILCCEGDVVGGTKKWNRKILGLIVHASKEGVVRHQLQKKRWRAEHSEGPRGIFFFSLPWMEWGTHPTHADIFSCRHSNHF